MIIFKRILTIAISFLFLGMTTACTSKSDSGPINKSTSEIYSEGIEVYSKKLEDKGLQQLPQLQELLSEEIESLYSLSSDDFEEASIYISPINVNATEIAIFKFDNEDQKKALEEAINLRLDNLNETWKTYLPDQYENVKNATKMTMGTNIMGFVISDEPELLVESITSNSK